MYKNFFKLITTVLLLVLFAFTQNSFAQTTLINSAGDGGFENGGTPTANSWTAINSSIDNWIVGTTPGVSAGTNCAFISSTPSSTQTWTYSQTSVIQHLYYDVTVPVGESKVTLNFKWKVGGEGSTTSDWDNMKVFWGAASSMGVPVANTALSSTFQVSGAGSTSGMYKLSSASYNSETINLTGVSGTTYRLAFSWKSDATTIANPPAAIDEVSLISSAPAPLVGGNIYPINGTQNPPTSFGSITTALAYLTSDGVTGSGQVVLELSTGYAGEPGPVFINAIPGTSATLGVTFRPALGYTALTSIAGAASPNQHAIKLNACSYITLDGRAGGIGTSRNWTVRVTGSGASGLGQMAVRMDNTNGNMTGNAVRYLIMEGEAANATGAIFQITGGSTTTISNIIIENNLIQSTSSASTSLRGYGITLAVAINIGNTGIIVRNNDITMFHGRGINLTGGFPGIEVYGNNIYHTVAITATTPIESAGIYFSTSSSPGAKIYSNYIYDLKYTNGTTSINGIQLVSSNATGTVPAFFNNRISIGDGITATTVPIYGFNYSSTTATYPYDVYFNSVLISGTATTGTANSAAFRKAAGNVFNLKNNIFYNARTNSAGTGTHWAIAVNNTTFTSIGNNDYFAGGTGGVLGTTDGTTTGNKATLALWNAAVPADLNSVSQNPNYLAGLKIDTTIPTQLESGGATGTGITTDFEGETRLSPPDIGADEFAGLFLDLSAPTIVYTPLLNTNSVANRTLVATITDPGSGVNGITLTAPRIYYKKSTDANAFVGNTSTDNGWKWAEATGASPYSLTIDNSIIFGGSVTTGDVIQYFVVAQDLATTPNVGANPSTGFVGTSVSAITSAPTTPSSYIISQAALAGDYTVGLLMFNQVTGKNIYFDKVVTRVMKEVVIEQQSETTSEKIAEKTEKGSVVQSDVALSVFDAKAEVEGIKQLKEVEEITWVPMENGQLYFGDLFVKKVENPQFNYPAGTDGIYATITAALADLNLRGLSGAVNFLLNDASYTTGETYPLVVNVANEGNLPTAINTVTIKPNTGVTSLIQGASANGPIFRIRNSYVSIDGSNAGGTDRSLTIENTSATGPGVVLIASSGTTPITNVTLKNCIVINGANTNSAVVVSDLAGTAGYFNNITIQNNSVQKAYIGIYALATVATGNGSGLLITGNDLNTSGANSIRLVGIYAQGVDGVTVSNNNIGNILNANAESVRGIWFATGTINGTISGNTISNISLTNTGAFAVSGLYITPAVANSLIINNNTISTLSCSGTNLSFAGILTFSPNTNITNNTVSGLTQLGAATFWGIASSGAVNANISGNTVSGMTTATSGTTIGMNVQGVSTSVNMFDNRISNIKNTNSTGYTAFGLLLQSSSATSNIAVYNNFIWDVAARGDVSSWAQWNGYGICVNTGGQYNIYHNTVALTTNQTQDGNPACINISTSAVSPLDIRDNIFANLQTVGTNRYAIISNVANTVFSNIDYNDYFTSGPNIGYIGAANVANLAAWQTATGKDLNSLSADPKFISATDLHIDTGFNVVGDKGFYLASVPTDIDGNTRSATTPDIGADEYIYVAPSVVDPTGVAATAISSSQIDVAFTPNASSDNVVIVWNLTGTFTDPVGAPPSVDSDFAGGKLLYNGLTSPVNHTSLNSSTTYYYKAFSYNSSLVIYSPGVATNATTPCGAVTVFPFAESFDGTTFPPTCWANTQVSGTGLWFRVTSGSNPTTTPHSGAGMAEFNCYSYSTGTSAILTTPQITFPADDYRVVFWMYRDTGYPTNADRVEVYYNTSANLTGATLLGTINRSTTLTPVVATAGWYEYKFNVPAASSGNAYIMFEGISQYGNNIFVDDVTIEQLPPIPVFAIDPTSKDFGEVITGLSSPDQTFTITNVGAGTLTITSGGISLTGTDAGQFTLTDANTYPINLGTSQSATVNVKFSPSSDGAKSATLNIVDNITESVHNIPLTGTGVTISLPYAQAFEGTTFPPGGWTNYGTKLWLQSLTEGRNGTKGARVIYQPAGTANLQSPSFILPATPNYRIKFWWMDNDIAALFNGINLEPKKNSGNQHDGPDIAGYDTTYFEITTNGGTNWTVLAFLSTATPQADYVQVVQDLNSYAGQTVSFRWRDVSDGSFSAYGTGLDDIAIEEIPACIEPTNLTVAGITNTSANIGWSGAATVDIDYGTPGHPAGTGTVVSGVTTNPYGLSGLTSATAYDVYVRQNCGTGNYSAWVGPLNFTTLCDLVALPFNETFDATTFPPSCWTRINAGLGNNWQRTTSTPYAGAGAMQYSYNSANAADAWMMTPGFALQSGRTYFVNFYQKVASASFPEKMKVTVGNAPDVISQTTVLWDNAGGTDLQNTTYLLRTVQFSCTTTGTYYFGFNCYSDADQWNLFVDEITIVEQPGVDLALTNFYQSSGLPIPRPGDGSFTDFNVSIEKNAEAQDGISVTSVNGISSQQTAQQSSDVNNTILSESFTGPMLFNNITVKGVVKNYGSNAASYNLEWQAGGVLQTPYAGPTVNSGVTDTATMVYTPSARGTFITNGAIVVVGDEVLGNNTASPFRMRVYPDTFTRTIYDRGDNVVNTYIGYGDPTIRVKAGVRFTASSNIKLAGVDYIFRTENITTGSVEIQVRAAGMTTGAPGAVLYSQTYTTSDYLPSGASGDYIHFPFEDTAPEISSGSDYWITIKAPLGVLYPGGCQSSGFTTGHSYIEDYPDTTAWYALNLPPEYCWIIRSVEVAPTPTTFQLSVQVYLGWNMVSIPGLNTPDQTIGTWWGYREPGSNVYQYSGGYVSVPTATPGLGYWMKNSDTRIYNTGDEWPAGGIQIVPHTPIAGASGWNMIGGYEIVATAALVTTNPPSLQIGPIYGYSNGYQPATTLNPGFGYWIKLTGAGQIIIPETLAKGEKPIEWFPENWGKIVLTDAAGISYTLYAVKGEVNLDQYELPPAPMAGMFDIRFSSGRIAEDINSSMQTIDMSGITYPLTVRVEGMDIRLMDETGKTINVNLKSGEGVVISDGTINKLMVSSQLIPEKYALEQNYPNPFNPSTVIEFSLPEDVGNVKLSIYNALGEKVAELVNTALVAGKYSYQWNAQNVATGMYIYELRTDKFVSVKKMLLLK